jgi:Putative transposase
MTLTHGEFIRRFALHILPKRFVKIRHYGFLSSNWKRKKLKVLQEKLTMQIVNKIPKTPYLPKCSCCKTGTLKTIEVFDKRGPPTFYLGTSQNANSCKL